MAFSQSFVERRCPFLFVNLLVEDALGWGHGQSGWSGSGWEPLAPPGPAAAGTPGSILLGSGRLGWVKCCCFWVDDQTYLVKYYTSSA